MTLIKKLHTFEEDKLIHPPKWMIDNTIYLTIMGSMAYGVSSQSSDIDIYGCCIPPKEMVFPHTAGHIIGFGNQIQKFEVWQEHHVVDTSSNTHNRDIPPNEYDFSVYGIVRYFQLLMDNNPNMLDSIYTPDRCVLHRTKISDHIRANRDIFLHKGSMHKFRGYSFAQMKKIRNKSNSTNPKRQESIQKFGFDVKFGYHIIRLALEAEQIAQEKTLDIERNGEILKSIRRGEWTLEYLEQWMEEKNAALETVFANSTLPYSPDQDAIKKLLLECLEMKFGRLDNLIQTTTDNTKLMADIKAVIARHGG